MLNGSNRSHHRKKCTRVEGRGKENIVSTMNSFSDSNMRGKGLHNQCEADPINFRQDYSSKELIKEPALIRKVYAPTESFRSCITNPEPVNFVSRFTRFTQSISSSNTSRVTNLNSPNTSVRDMVSTPPSRKTTSHVSDVMFRMEESDVNCLGEDQS